MKKIIFAFVLFIFTLFILTIVLTQYFNENKQLSFKSEIKFVATKTHQYKGFVTINDSITISGNTPRINIDSSLYIVRYKDFGSLDAPYKIMKKQNNDTIIVIKDYETLYYKLNY